MKSSTTTIYDQVIYPSALYAQTHPASLAVVAKLSGMEPVPVERCRVLELGCGDGFNLLSMAYALPDSEFLGVDLASQPIASGNGVVERLGIKNIALRAMDVVDLGEDVGRFDYIIAHGLYSWVPPGVRQRILEICSRHLSAQGVAYVSYNAYPGNHLRDLVRGMMRYHATHFPNPTDQIVQARSLVKWLSEAGDKSDPYLQILGRECERIEEYTDTAFFHDDLSAINQPFYFHEFMSHAAGCGLQFLGEAELTAKREITYPPHVAAVLNQMDPADVIGGEQYRDFLRCRAFRQTLLCHEGMALNRQLDADYMHDIFLAAELRPASGMAAIHDESPELFLGRKKSEFETNRPLIKAAFASLNAAWPRFVPFAGLCDQVRSTLGSLDAENAGELAAALLQVGIAGGLELRTQCPQFVTQVSQRPVASALARVQSENLSRVATLLHGVVQIDDELARLLLRILDGTRDRPALLAKLQEAIDHGDVITSTTLITEADLEAQLEKLAGMALLVA